MSVFELGGDDRRALLESARLNISSQQEPEYTEAEKTATGAAMGTMRALAESGRTALKLAGAAPVVYDAAKSAITGEYTTSAQDAFFKTFVDDVGKGAIEYWTPQAEHTNKAGDIIGGVVGGLAQFAATGFNPFLFGAEAGLNTQGALTDQGVDLGTSSAVGGVAAVASAAGAFLPPSVGGTFIKKLASGAAINLALGTAERGIDGAILQGEGYNKAAEQYSWKDSTSAAIDAFMGAAFGVMPSSMPAPKLKEVQDSVLTVASGKHAALDVAPGDPATPASAAIHHNALSAAIKQIVEGEPVNVGDKINKAEFSLRDELPSVKQLRGDLTDLLTEDGRNQFAQQLLDHQGPEGAYKTHEEARFVVDQFGAGIQKLHGAGVPMERLSQLRTSFGKPAEDGAVFNQYAGVKAQGADLTSLQQAKQKIDSGADPEQIRQETGWHKWEDGRWRFEIDDSQASFISNGSHITGEIKKTERGGSYISLRLGDMLKHDPLFSAYPFLKDMNVTLKDYGDRGSATLRGSGKDASISIDKAFKENGKRDFQESGVLSKEEIDSINLDELSKGSARLVDAKGILSSLLHEVQHAIQDHEGHAVGGIAAEFEAQNNRAFYDRANATEKAIELKKKAQEADANGGVHPVSGISAKELHAEHNQWMAERDAAHERLYADGAPDANNQYKRLAGEVEARDTQARMDMTAAERAASKPYASQGIPDDQVIIRHGSTDRMNSVDTPSVYKGDPVTELWSILGFRDEAYKYDKPIDSKVLGDHFDNVKLDIKTSHDPVMSKDENANATLVETMDGKHGYVLERGNKVWMDVSQLDTGDKGSAFYRAVADYAKSTGKKFIEDPAGLSDVAMHRRLENMISSAVLHGTTDHLGIGEKQARGGAGVSGLRWIDGDHKFNLRGMALASYESVARHFPELENVDYNISTGKFEDLGDGSEWTDQRFRDLAQEARRREAAGKSIADRRKDPVTEGLSTLKRTVLTSSILRQSGEGQSRLLDSLRGRLAESLPDSLKNILYQKGGDAFARNVKGDTESPQGQINFGIDGEKLNATISLFETANKSTALHELSHNFLEIYKHLNQFDDTPASIKEDYAEMRRLIGADDAGSPLTKDHHERFAEAFEQYTREGKAPTPALKRAFEHFKEWMTAIYQRAADLGAPINDDVRAMFDKMLGKEMPVEHFDPLLKNKDVQNELRRQAQNAGWAEVGGKVIMDENRVVTGRTSWIPKEEWYTAGMGSQADVERAVGKAIRGEKLSKKQQSIVAAMLDSPAHDAAREDMQLNAAMSKTTEGETPEQKAARMAEMDAFFDSIPEAAGVSDILKSADDLLIPQDDGSTVSARQLMESLHTELQESDAMPKVYDAAINCFLRG